MTRVDVPDQIPVIGDVTIALALLTPRKLRARDEAAFVDVARGVLASAEGCERQLRTMVDFGVGESTESEALQLAGARVAQHAAIGVKALDADDLVTLLADVDLLASVAARLHPGRRAAFDAAVGDADIPGPADPPAFDWPARTLRTVPLRAALAAAVLLMLISAGFTWWMVGAPGGSATVDGGRNDARFAPASSGIPGSDPANSDGSAQRRPGDFEVRIEREFVMSGSDSGRQVFEGIDGMPVPIEMLLGHPSPRIRIASAAGLLHDAVNASSASSAPRGNYTVAIRTIVRAGAENPTLVRFAAESLTDVPPDQLAPQLVDVVAESPDLADQVLFLMMVNGGAMPGVIEVANHGQPAARRAAARQMMERLHGEPIEWPTNGPFTVRAGNQWFAGFPPDGGATGSGHTQMRLVIKVQGPDGVWIEHEVSDFSDGFPVGPQPDGPDGGGDPESNTPPQRQQQRQNSDRDR